MYRIQRKTEYHQLNFTTNHSDPKTMTIKILFFLFFSYKRTSSFKIDEIIPCCGCRIPGQTLRPFFLLRPIWQGFWGIYTWAPLGNPSSSLRANAEWSVAEENISGLL